MLALTAIAACLEPPALIVFTGTRNQKKSQVAGAIAPRKIVEVLALTDSRHGVVHERAEE